MIGRFASGIIGFGILLVNGWILVPKPPAMITAFKIFALLMVFYDSEGGCLSRDTPGIATLARGRSAHFFRGSSQRLFLQHLFHFVFEFPQVGGFHHIAVGQPCGEIVLVTGKSGTENYRQIMALFDDPLQEIEAAFILQFDVQQNQVEFVFLERFNGFGRAGGGRYFVSLISQFV